MPSRCGAWPLLRESAELSRFLEALAAWIDDADGWYSNADGELPTNGDWRFFARALDTATMYELADASQLGCALSV
ncbi:hypothetical protein ABZ614_09450 [Streptomyces sp. NPDC013178]|uniref:DUF7660 family protein n=1 Tax=Streptomyces sp. NPDC013178 TaxID=3155118 RepID=UPI0033E96F69